MNANSQQHDSTNGNDSNFETNSKREFHKLHGGTQYQSLKLEDVIDPNPPTYHSSGGVMEAIAQMNQRNVRGSRRYSYVLIVEKLKLVGIITEPDIVRLTAAGIDLSQTKIKDVMTTALITLNRSDLLDVHEMMTIMRQNKIRHLPIVNELRHLAGLVSVNTICRALHPSNLLKFRRVDEAMTTEVFQAPMNTSVLNLSKMMAENRTSCIVIVDSPPLETQSQDSRSAKPIGIVTERDIVQFQMLGIDIANTIAQQIMSTPLVCMKTSDSLMEVHSSMEKLRVRRLVIVGDSGELRGIVSQFNMLRVLDPVELFGVIETLQRELEERTSQLQQEKELAQITLQSIGDAVITTDAMGIIVNFNSMAQKLTGWSVREAVGQLLSDVFELVNEHTREPVANPVEEVLRENKVVELVSDTVLIARDSTEYAIEDSAAPIRDRQGKLMGAVIVFRDVSKSRHLSNQLSWQANHDALTGLYNRREFEKRVVEAISSAQNQGYSHALCFLDLDKFKIVNDTCGHIAGDELLKQVTSLLLQQVRSSDTLARLGGDEFGLLLNQCSLSIAIKIANNLRQCIGDYRFGWQGRTFSIGVSIGLVEISFNTNLSEVMNKADVACYTAKANGRNCIHVHRDNDVELQLGQKQWSVRLNQALEDDRFCLYAQKIIPIKDRSGHREIDRCEILLRLQDGKQLILPDAFIPAAERYNLMPAIDRWVISHFLASYHSYWLLDRQSNNNSLYGIHLSGASINSKQFCPFLKEQLDRYQVDPSIICFEIKETTAVSQMAIASQFFKELKQMGCSIALDNFGSGMSSAIYVENLSVDYLKIDGSLIENIADNKVVATIEYFNRIAKIMGIETIAEFVEDDFTLQQLQNIGVDYAQGYAIEQPQPLSFK